LPKWPFIAGDVVLLGVAWFIVNLSESPSAAAIIAAVACAGLGSLLAVFPFVAEYARRQEEAIDERQRSLEGLSRMINDSAEQISIAANGIRELSGAFQKHLTLTADLTEKLSRLSTSNARKPESRPKAAPEPEPSAPPPEEPPPQPKEPSEPVSELALDNAAPAKDPAPEAEAAPVPRKRSPRKPKSETASGKKESASPLPSPTPPVETEANGEVQEKAEEPPAIQTAADGGTRLNVTAYIGIGNRLFIRGEGGGLSWDHGVPLQFVSIGKWRWEVANPDGPVRFKLYKNDDQECAELGTQTLEPGTEQEIKAAFP